MRPPLLFHGMPPTSGSSLKQNKELKKKENEIVFKIKNKFGTTNVVGQPIVYHKTFLAMEAIQNNKG